MRAVDVLSPMLGTVAMHLMADGAEVEEGERVLEIECMKVMFGVSAPASGVLRYTVPLGVLVGEGETVATITPKETTP